MFIIKLTLIVLIKLMCLFVNLLLLIASYLDEKNNEQFNNEQLDIEDQTDLSYIIHTFFYKNNIF